MPMIYDAWGKDGRMVNTTQQIQTHDFSDRGDGTCDHPVYGTTCGYPMQHVIHGYKSLPADWFEDSSLETWFPLTAEEMKRTKAENLKLRILLTERLEVACKGTCDASIDWHTPECLDARDAISHPQENQ